MQIKRGAVKKVNRGDVIARELMWYNDFGQKENDKKNRIK